MAIVLSLTALAAAVEQSPAPLDWLVGEWCTEAKAGKQTCERWTPMVRGEMHGTSETRRGAAILSAERMRIAAKEGRLVFHAEPRGQAAADFPSISGAQAPTELTFENRAHDYPQRIRYWREGELLMAEIALADGGKPMRWAYHRVKR